MARGNGSCRLSQLNKGKKGIIVGYGSEDIPVKIYELGLLPGVCLELKQRVPFSGPLCISLTDTDNSIALRKNEAHNILIETTE